MGESSQKGKKKVESLKKQRLRCVPRLPRGLATREKCDLNAFSYSVSCAENGVDLGFLL